MKEISAGGIVFRKRDDHLDVLLIQDRYGRTTLPKGHLEEGETVKQAALREVEEETGVKSQIVGDPLGVIHYRCRVPGKGPVMKEVTYYLMEALTEETRAQLQEVRDAFWHPLERLQELHAASGYHNNEVIIERALKRLAAKHQQKHQGI
ncbi:NUDIX domain-containing protein [Tumebacillus sp. DT12]|uniref:NUDIX domain-containing protein n=1 Tax=Tumebacillus lacus TaxID=2995335 RepID=A0ABT3X7M4_9BACL|nr:NUDIX domain-containing protein [Tumebacillus lacus]MCX7570739.1 NUDIX domain-containing protein [Tumebacillus lacus]